MAKPRSNEPAKPQGTPDTERKTLGTSFYYCIRKYGLYAYEVIRIDPKTLAEQKVGVENVYGVVASDLVDLMFREINKEHG